MKKTTLGIALSKKSESLNQEKQIVPPLMNGDKNGYKAPCRMGKKPVTGWFPADVVRQLKQIGLEKDMSVQEMIREALNDYFAKNRKPEIA
jgi:hypothetical protein